MAGLRRDYYARSQGQGVEATRPLFDSNLHSLCAILISFNRLCKHTVGNNTIYWPNRKTPLLDVREYPDLYSLSCKWSRFNRAHCICSVEISISRTALALQNYVRDDCDHICLCRLLKL